MSKYTSETWPIAAKMAFGTKTPQGDPIERHPEEWRRQLELVRKLGYSAFDPTDVWLPFWEMSDGQAAEFLGVVEEFGLSIPSLSMGRRSVVDIDHGEEYLDMAHTFIDFAQRCGASIVNVGFMQDLTPAQEQATWFWLSDGHKDDPALRVIAVERIRELAQHAAEAGVQIALEMYEDTYCGSADDAVAFVLDVDRDNVGLNPDLGNLVRLHRPVEPWQSMHDKVLPHANFWHIKNYIRDEDPATGSYFTFPVPLETGIINYRQVIEQALRLGFEGPFVTEHYGGDWLGVGVRNMRYIREVLALALDE